MISITVSNSSPLPLYKQIYNRIASAVITGELESGSTLPPIRTVSIELKVSMISVRRAWEELERDGFIVTAVGRGSFVAELSDEEKSLMRLQMIKDTLKPEIGFLKALGADKDELCRVISQMLK